jgi:ubiquinone/menaquinone biosynthesis C-methylase UbiE
MNPEELKINKINFINQFKNKPWMQDIIASQDEIEALATNPYYKSGYRAEEIKYWFHIAQWLREETKVDNLLDIGCAYGTLALYTKKIFNANVYAVDFIKYISDALVEKHDFNYKVSNFELEEFPWDDVKFDVILLTEVFEHFNFKASSALQRMHRLLTPGGSLYISTPDAKEWGHTAKYYNSHNDLPYPNRKTQIVDDHVYQYNLEEMMDVIYASDFKIEKFDYAPGTYYRHFNMKVTKV